MQRAAPMAGCALRIQRLGDVERIGVDLDHAVDRVLVDGMDAREIRLGERSGAEGAGGHLTLHFGEGHFFKFGVRCVCHT